jgi:hypothetical protein
MKPILCIYHADCLDGFTAAWVVRRWNPFTIFYAGIHGEAPPDCTGRDVIFVDFCYKSDVMQRIVDQASSVVVLDHHKTAVPEMEKVSGIFDNVIDVNRSGAMIAWDYFFPHKRIPPLLVQYVQDRDLWRFNMSGTREVCAVLFTLRQEFQQWDEIHLELTSHVNSVIAKGELLLAKHKKDVDDLIRLGKHRINILGHNVPAVNCAPMHASDIGNLLAPGEPFAAMYQFLNGQLAFSLRSTDEGVDVSEIAKHFGGGGHRNASGFKIKLPLEALLASLLEPSRNLPELNLYRILEPHKGLLPKYLMEAKALNDALQSMCVQNSDAWHAHETLDDKLFAIASTVECFDEYEFRHSKEFLALDRTEQVLLNRQSHVMHGLMEIYDERINFLKQKPRS